MPVTLSDFLNFPFNGGRGIRTNQLDGEITLDQVVAAIRDGSIVLPDETTGVLQTRGWRRIRGASRYREITSCSPLTTARQVRSSPSSATARLAWF